MKIVNNIIIQHVKEHKQIKEELLKRILKVTKRHINTQKEMIRHKTARKEIKILKKPRETYKKT